jgi:hypothetical protein
MWKRQALELPNELQNRIRRAVTNAFAEGQYRVAPERFNKDYSASERNQYTTDVLKALSWINSPEGRSNATSKGKTDPRSILADLIDMVLYRAIEDGFSPLQVLYFGLQRVSAVMGTPDDLRLVLEFIATILAEAADQHREGMVQVSYLQPEKPRVDTTIRKWLETGIQGEYWLGGAFRTSQQWVHFAEKDDADAFRVKLVELGVTVTENPPPETTRD